MSSPFILIIFPFFFIGMWLFVLAIISLVGGWYSLAKKFELTDYIGITIIRQYYWKTISIGYFGRYSNCINITITNRGIIFKPFFLFSFLHKPIFIKWEYIKNIELKSFVLFKIASINTDNTTIRIYGKIAEDIKEICQTYK